MGGVIQMGNNFRVRKMLMLNITQGAEVSKKNEHSQLDHIS